MTEHCANKHGHPHPSASWKADLWVQMCGVGAEGGVKVPWDSLHSHSPTSPPSPSREPMHGRVALGSSWGWESSEVRFVVPIAGKKREKNEK